MVGMRGFGRSTAVAPLRALRAAPPHSCLSRSSLSRGGLSKSGPSRSGLAFSSLLVCSLAFGFGGCGYPAGLEPESALPAAVPASPAPTGSPGFAPGPVPATSPASLPTPETAAPGATSPGADGYVLPQRRRPQRLRPPRLPCRRRRQAMLLLRFPARGQAQGQVRGRARPETWRCFPARLSTSWRSTTAAAAAPVSVATTAWSRCAPVPREARHPGARRLQPHRTRWRQR